MASDAMLTASNPIIAQASAWIAVVMLLVQSLPAANCSCGDGSSPVGDKVAQAAASCCSKTATKSCCGGEAKSTCCSQAKRASCCNKDRQDRSVAGKTACRCGQTCSCGALPTPTQDPAAPVPHDDNRQDRLELATYSPQAVIAIVSTRPATTGLGYSDQLSPATALDRCIMLSRFTC